jgi:hypothetical protein
MVAVGALFAVGATAIWAALSSYSDGRDSWEPDSVVLRIFCWVLMVPAVLLGMAGIFMGVAGIGFGLFFVASLLLGRI